MKTILNFWTLIFLCVISIVLPACSEPKPEIPSPGMIIPGQNTIAPSYLQNGEPDYYTSGEELAFGEKIAEITLGMNRNDVLPYVKPGSQIEEAYFNGLTGKNYQDMLIDGEGILVEVESIGKSTEFAVSAICVYLGGDIKTTAGVGVGSSKADVVSVYGDFYNPYESIIEDVFGEETLVFGSRSCGLTFELDKNGIVREFTVGRYEG